METSERPGNSEAGHSLREMRWTAVFWPLMMFYTVGVCTVYGYGRTAESLTYFFGFPDWVFWGVVVPWGVSTVFSIWFALCVMQDDDIRKSDAEEQVTE